MIDLTIVGIDPGTTVAYAILDIEGNIIELYSAKELTLSQLIERVIKKGKPIITACDVASPPNFVNNFAIKTGSKLISPDTDLQVKEKEALARKHKPKNTHQMDALGAALYAFKIIGPVFDRINQKLKEMGKLHLRKEVLELVIKHDMSIKNAVTTLEEPEKEESKIIKKVTHKRIMLESDYINLYKKLKIAEKDMKLLKHQNNMLIQKIDSLEKRNKFLMKKITDVVPKEKTRDLLYFKNKTINSLALEKDEKELEVKMLQQKLLNLNKLILDNSNKTMVKRLNKLSIDEINKKAKVLPIKKGDILLIDDLTSFSQKAVSELKPKVSTIIYKKSSKKVNDDLPFTCLDSKNMNLKEDEYVAFINTSNLERELGKKDILSKVLKEYQAERSS